MSATSIGQEKKTKRFVRNDVEIGSATSIGQERETRWKRFI